jgi:hypothetical protein
MEDLLTEGTPELAEIDECERVWGLAHAFIKQRPANVTHENAASLLLFLCTWRLRFTCSKPEARVPIFVVTCALRMLLLDILNAPGVRNAFPEAAAQVIATTVDAELAHLANIELANALPFDPANDGLLTVLQEMREHGFWVWNTTAFNNWNRIAFGICFAEHETETNVIVGDAVALKCLAQFDYDCVHRLRLRHLLDAATAATIELNEDRLKIAMIWARKNNKHLNDDLFQQGREAIVSLFLTPESERNSSGHPSKKLAGWDAARATQAHAASQEGFKLLDVEDDGAYRDTLFLCLFQYAMKQLFDVDFRKLFYVSDLLSDEALLRIEKYKKERLLKPPPLLVFSLGCWYLVYKSETRNAIARSVMYTSGILAIVDWLLYVKNNRKGCVFLSKDISSLIKEITEHRVVEDTRLMLTLEKLL